MRPASLRRSALRRSGRAAHSKSMNPTLALALCLVPFAAPVASRTELLSYWSLESEILDDACTGATPARPEDPPRLIFDRPEADPEGVSSVRSTADALPPELSAQGLAALRASGSSQFSRHGLDSWVRVLQALGAPQPAHITVVDLRQEPHGLAGPQAMSWHAWSNWLNRDLSPAAAWEDEVARLAALQAQAGSVVPAFRVCKARDPAGAKIVSYFAAPLQVAAVASEQAAVQGAGMHYLRLPMVDHTGAPTDAVVEAFVAAVAQRDPNSWWHFHCRKGQGRTALFMAMLDMLHNARSLSLEQIAARQAALNPVDILAQSPHEPEKSAARRAFAHAFYAYCRAGMPGAWHRWPRAKWM